jgi:FMN phosphatase YigB (HAD superfamily)
MSPAAPIEAVTFDFWNTLMQEQAQARDRRLGAWLGLLEGEGAAVERDALDAAYDRSWHRFQQAWHANLRYDAADAVRDLLDHLGLSPSDAVVADLVAVITDPDPSWRPDPTENVGEALEALSSAGVRIGIICDVGLTPSRILRRYLQDHGLLGYFHHWSFSDEVGTFKPDPAIFDHALGGLGRVPAGRAAHIGDLRRTDVAGAQNVGMLAVRYSGVHDDPASDEAGTREVEGDVVLVDHRDLPAALGLA